MDIRFKLKQLADIFFQNGCIVCGKASNSIICPDCNNNIRYITHPLCIRCGKPFKAKSGVSHVCIDCIKGRNKFIKLRAVFEYSGALVKLVQRFKFGDQVNLVEFFSNELARLYKTHFSADGIDILIPVPLSRKRLKHRSYNQTQLLVKHLSRKIFIPFCSDILVKVKETPPQSKLKAEQRYDNVKQAYMVVNNRFLKHKKVLLIDDVITTGATVNACTKALIRAGAKAVYVMTIAMRV